MIFALLKGFFELTSPPFLRLVLWAMLVILLSFSLSLIALYYGLDWVGSWIGEGIADLQWVQTLQNNVPYNMDFFIGFAPWIRAILTVIFGFFLVPVIALTVTGLYLDSVVDAIEQRDYPDQVGQSRVGVRGNVLICLQSAAKVIVLNILALPLYFILFITVAFGSVMLYYAINGYILGMDLLLLVLLHHHKLDEAKSRVRKHKVEAMFLGAVTMFLFTIPGINLLTLLIGTAAAVHYLHQGGGRDLI